MSAEQNIGTARQMYEAFSRHLTRSDPRSGRKHR